MANTKISQLPDATVPLENEDYIPVVQGIGTAPSTKKVKLIDLKLSVQNERFKGKYTSLINLQTAYSSANAGDYAQVDEGEGFDVINYNWDDDDGWIEGGSGSAATTTDELLEGSTNLYFTSQRVIDVINPLVFTSGSYVKKLPSYIPKSGYGNISITPTNRWTFKADPDSGLPDFAFLGPSTERLYTLPDKTGKFALLEDLASINLHNVTDNGASYTIVLSDGGKMVEINKISANNLIIPLNSSVAFPIGIQIIIYQMGAGHTTIVATGGVTIRQRDGKLKMAGQHALATLIKRDMDTWVLSGDLAS